MHRPPAFTIDPPLPFDLRGEWSDRTGPAWITFDDDGDPILDTPNEQFSPGLHAFTRAAVNAARHANPGVTYDLGTVYATRHPIGCLAGDLHFDSGHYDPNRQVTRVACSWSTDGTRLANVFLRSVRPAFAQRLAGLRVDDLPPELMAQPLNGQLAVFDEGLHLHGRPAVDISADPAAYGVFASVSLYRDGQAPDLHCPRLADLRGYGLHAGRAANHTTVRTAY